MKTIQLIPLVFLVFITGCNCSNQLDSASTTPSESTGIQNNTDIDADDAKKSDAKIKRYSAKEGTVVYNITGHQKGTETLSWREYGAIESKRTQLTLSMMGIVQKTDTLIIMNFKNGWTYTVDYSKGTVNKMKLAGLGMMGQLGDNAEKFGKQMAESIGSEKTGTDHIAGKDCEVWTNKNFGSSSCIWNGVLLKNEVGMGPVKMLYLATEVHDEALGDEAFTVPEDMPLQEIENPMDRLKNLQNFTQ